MRKIANFYTKKLPLCYYSIRLAFLVYHTFSIKSTLLKNFYKLLNVHQVEAFTFSLFYDILILVEKIRTETMQTLLKTTGAYRLLKNEGKTGFSHAYLLLLEDGKNLRVALKTFAKLLFSCDEPKTKEEARIAALIDAESFADCVFYPAEGKKLMVEDAEKIVEESTLAPLEGDKKVFVLGDFAEANVQTQNKLLKLLEEPPKGVIFLLGATSVFPVLPTVLSRTKKLEILSFSIEEVTACLTRIYGDKYEEKTLAVCAATSGGSVGDACAFLEGGYYESLLSAAFSLVLSPLHKLPIAVKLLGETSYKKELLSLLRLIYRDALLLKNGTPKSLLLPAMKARCEEVASAYSKGALLFAQEAISKAEREVKFNAVFSQCVLSCIANILNFHKV